MTTLLELSAIAERTISATGERLPIRTAVIVLATMTPMLLLVMALTGGAVRWIFGASSAVSIGVLLVWGGLQVLPRLATRLGPLELPVAGARPGTTWLTSFRCRSRPCRASRPVGRSPRTEDSDRRHVALATSFKSAARADRPLPGRSITSLARL